jgi:hypothetical protein
VPGSSSEGSLSRRYISSVMLACLVAREGVGTLSRGPQENPNGADSSKALAENAKRVAPREDSNRIIARRMHPSGIWLQALPSDMRMPRVFRGTPK